MTWYVDGEQQTGNPADYHQKNGETIAVYFLPKGAEKPFPPSACAAFSNISDAAIRRCITQEVAVPGDRPPRPPAHHRPGATTDTTAPATTSTP